jgi:hypothetical protein
MAARLCLSPSLSPNCTRVKALAPA